MVLRYLTVDGEAVEAAAGHSANVETTEDLESRARLVPEPEEAVEDVDDHPPAGVPPDSDDSGDSGEQGEEDEEDVDFFDVWG